jgi:polysaccharide biosynthesis transport protein
MDQGSKQVHYSMLRNDVDVNREIYQTMVQKVKEAGVMAALRTPNARVVSAAVEPTTPSSPKLVIALALAILLATVASLLYILIAERRNRSLRAPGETEGFLPNAELAAIPHAHLPSQRLHAGALNLARAEGQKHHPMLEHWSRHDGTILSEAFRVAGTSILLRTDGGTQAKILLITSPHSQCGKTMSTANLAISLAEGARKVVVVDGDLRKSGLSHLFGFEKDRGLSDILSDSGEEDPLKLIQATDFPRVWIVPSGTVSDNAAKLLQSDRLHSVLQALRAEFDFVLLDGPPLLGLADARLLGQRAEGIVLVCRAGQTQGSDLNEAWSILKDDGANILGTILNGYDLRTERPSRYRTYLRYAGRIS